MVFNTVALSAVTGCCKSKTYMQDNTDIQCDKIYKTYSFCFNYIVSILCIVYTH